MRKNIARVMVVVALLVVFMVGSAVSVLAAETQNVAADELLVKINNLREENGLPALRADSELTSYAQTRAEEASVLWSHTRPNGKQGYEMINPRKWRGENLSWASENGAVDTMFTDLCNSPTHLDNMLFGEFTKIGIATYTVNGNMYAAYMFSN